MKSKKYFSAIIVTALIAALSCKGTSTDEYLNGDFIDSLGEDTTPPNIISPRIGEKLLTLNPTDNSAMPVLLQWTSKNNASEYILEIGTGKNETTGEILSQITGSPFILTETFKELTLTESRRYYWRIRADITAPGQYGSSYFDAMNNTVYVYCSQTEATCSDSGMVGNLSKPYKTITAAIAEADRLGIKNVKVAARGGAVAAYIETVPVLSGINLSGGYASLDPAHPELDFSEGLRDLTRNGNKTIIEGSNVYGVFAGNIFQNTTIEGFIINGPNEATGTFAVYIINSARNLIIQNCTITGGVSTSFYSAGIAMVDSFSTIQNNTITGGTGSISMGMYLKGFGSPWITNNTIAGANLTDLTGGECESTGILLDWSFPEITNNTISGGNIEAGKARSYAVNSAKESMPTLRNNLIRGGNLIGPSSSNNDFTTFAIFNNDSSGGDISHNIIISGDIDDAGSSTQVASIGIQNEEISRPSIANNIIVSGSVTTTGGTSAGIKNRKSSPSIMNNTIFSGSADNSYAIINSQGDSTNGANPTINYNILFTANPASGYYGIFEQDAYDTPQEVTNNLIFDAGTALYANNTGSGAWDYYADDNGDGDINKAGGALLNDLADMIADLNKTLTSSQTISDVFADYASYTDPANRNKWIIKANGLADLDLSGGWTTGDRGADAASAGRP